MALQVLATLGLRTKGFFSALATSEGAWARFARSAGGTFGRGFASSAGTALGQGLMFGAINKLFAPKPPAKGGTALFENVTGIDPTKRGVRHRIKMGLAAGALGGAALGAAGIARAREVQEMADVSGVDTTKAQIIDKLARKNARSFDDVALALQHMGRARREAAEGNEELRQTLRGYGITLEDLQDPTKDNLDLLQQLGRSIEGVNLNARQRQDLRDLLGRSGDKLGPTLKGLSKGSDSLLITPKAITNIQRGWNLMKSLGGEVKALGANLVGGGLEKMFAFAEKPAVKSKLQGVRQFAGAIGNWMSGKGFVPPAVEQMLTSLAPGVGKGGGPMFDDQNVIEAAEAGMAADSAFKELKFSKLTPSQQESELRRRLRVHFAEMRSLDGKDPSQGKMIEQHKLAAIGIAEQLRGLQGVDLEAPDALARLGGLAQGAGNVAPGPDVVAEVIKSIEAVEKAINDKTGGFP